MKNKIIVIITYLLLLSIGDVAAAWTCTGMPGTIWAAGSDLDSARETFCGGEIYIARANSTDHNVSLMAIVYWTITEKDSPGPVKVIIVDDAAKSQPALDPYPLGVNPASITPRKIWTITGASQHLGLNGWHSPWPYDCEKPRYDFKTPANTLYHIPEFPTIALPIAAVLGLIFFFQQRKKRSE